MLIPPSIILILYGIVTETSVVRLFFAGVIPGPAARLGNILSVVVIAWFSSCRAAPSRRAACGWSSRARCPALGMPVVILGGLYGGLFTPTEAAAAACGYALLYGLLRGGSSASSAADHVPRAQPHRGDLFLVGSVGRVPVPARKPLLAAEDHETVTGWGLTPLGFIFAFMGVLLFSACSSTAWRWCCSLCRWCFRWRMR
jgi:hypothetical protein